MRRILCFLCFFILPSPRGGLWWLAISAVAAVAVLDVPAALAQDEPRVSIALTAAAEGGGGAPHRLATRAAAATTKRARLDLRLTVRGGPITETASVEWKTEDGTATAGEDYVAASGIFTFPPGSTTMTKTAYVTILEDEIDEPDETLCIVLFNVNKINVVERTKGCVVLRDNDPPARMEIDDVEVLEGDAGSTVAATFTVRLSPESGWPVTVNYATADYGTATAGSDYEAAMGSLAFAPGETEKTITVAVTGDADYEPDETFPVVLRDATHATLARANGTGTIRNDDDPPAWSADPALTDMRADPDTITEGECSTLRWTPREDVESVVVGAGGEELATVFAATATSYEVCPTETTTHTLSAQDSEGAPLGDFPVTVTAFPRPPTNDRPVAVGVIPDQVLDEGAGPETVDLTPFFEDPDGGALIFRAASSDTDVVTVTVMGAVLTLTPVVYGSAAVTVTAEDPGGLSATKTFRVRVSDRLVKAVLRNTLAAMARGHLASARMILGRRVTAGKGERSRLTVMGRSVPLGTDAAQAAAAQMTLNWPSGFERRPAWFSDGSLGTVASPGGGSDDLLRGTDFLLALGGDSGETRPGPRWTVWGQGDIQTFQGTPAAFGYDSRYDGDLRTGHLGTDVRLTDRWLAGLALSRSRGTGDWHVGTARGRLTTTLTAAYPYLHWSDGTTSVSAMGGGGRGEAKNVREVNGRVGTSALGLRLGLVEVRRRLGAAGGGVELGVRGGAAWARLETERGQETIDSLGATVHQMRLGAEVSRPIRMRSGLALAPFGEVNARRDGGAGQTGVGLELAGGLRAAYGMLRLDAQGRLLTLHSATGYRERGAGVTLSVGDQGQEGLSLSLASRWGDQASGDATLWQDQVYRRHRPGEGRDAWALDARADYGVRLRSGRLLTWFGSYGQSWHGPRFQFGVRIGVLGNGVSTRMWLSGGRED